MSIGLVKLSRQTESILGRVLRFFDEYRPVNRSHCGVCGGGDSDTSLLLTSPCGYSQHRAWLRRPVRRVNHPRDLTQPGVLRMRLPRRTWMSPFWLTTAYTTNPGRAGNGHQDGVAMRHFVRRVQLAASSSPG